MVTIILIKQYLLGTVLPEQARQLNAELYVPSVLVM
jgi:hypothetical protein